MSVDIQELVNRLSGIFGESLVALIERRNSLYGTEIAALENERVGLVKENGAIEEAREKLAQVLPAQGRELRRQSDALLVAGKADEAQAKLREAEQAENAPAKMVERQQEISTRLAAIGKQKRAIVRRTFHQWHDEILPVIRAAEQGFFLTLLDGLEREFYAWQDVTETALDPMAHPGEPGLFTQGDLSSLTADERSAEWRSAGKWYAGRR